MMGSKRFKRAGYGFRNRILFILSLIEFVTILFLTIFFSHYIKEVSTEMMVEKVENRSQQLLEVFSRKFASIDNDMDNFILNEYVQKSLLNSPLDLLDKEMVSRALLLIAEYSDYYLYLDNKQNIYSQKTFQGSVTDVREQLIGVLGNDYSKTKLIWMEDILFGEGGMQLFACRYIRPVDQNHEPGILIIRLRLESMQEEAVLSEEEPGNYFIVDHENRICLTYGDAEETSDEGNKTILQAAFGEGMDTGIKTAIDVQNGLVSIHENTENNFKIIAQVPYHILMRTYYHALAIVILLFIIIMLILFAVSLKVSDWLANPIRQINHYMTEFNEQRMGKYLSLNTNTELDSIGESYNLMIDRIRKLMEEVKSREEELRKSEMKSLLYQINPHFLYNTLDVIYMLARMHHESEIMQMIEALTKLLRINLSNGSDIISIEEELTYVKAYMDIMKVRNDDLFSYEIECEENISEIMIIKLLLQPLVENSIKHGFKNMDEGGEIFISVSRKKEKIEFLVKNNGEMMELEKAESINRMTEVPIEELNRKGKKKGYGINNIIKRLRLYYYDNVDFYFAVEDGFTVCHISIPTKEVEDEKV